jgi:hypothetical protein
MDVVAEANRFAGKAEDYVYEAHWAKKPEVALVNPRSSQIWEASTGDGRSFEDTKWIYLALRQAGIPVDVLSEQQLIEGKASDYKVLYVVGANLHHKAAEKLRDWVRGGGVLWTNIGGLARDEANEPAPEMNAMLGLGKRNVEVWSEYAGSGAVTIAPIDEKEVPAFAPIKMADGTTSPDLRAVIAREALDVSDAANTKVLASFADGRPAFVRHQYGKGAAYVVGTYPGAVYSRKARQDDYDMLRDYDPLLRNLIAKPALDAEVYRPVVPAVGTVEAVMLAKDDKRSIALINWTFKSPKTLVPLENLRIALPDVGDFKTVRSLQTGVLKVEGTGKSRSVILPKLNEIDLLVLE